MNRLLAKLREFFDDPAGTAGQWLGYLITLGIAVFLLILAVRWFIAFVGAAVR
jgi:hypothetical protein